VDIITVTLTITALGSMSAAAISLWALIQGKQTHKLINSRMDELLKAAKDLARAEGIASGEEAQRNRDKML
jgi:hypothetical protein